LGCKLGRGLAPKKLPSVCPYFTFSTRAFHGTPPRHRPLTSYHTPVPSSGSYGDWATPQKPPAGLFSFPLSRLPPPLGEPQAMISRRVSGFLSGIIIDHAPGEGGGPIKTILRFHRAAPVRPRCGPEAWHPFADRPRMAVPCNTIGATCTPGPLTAL